MRGGREDVKRRWKGSEKEVEEEKHEQAEREGIKRKETTNKSTGQEGKLE